MVGRDVLVGGLLGLAHTSAIYLAPLAQQWVLRGSVEPNPSLNVSYLEGFRQIAANLLIVSGNAIFFAFAPLLLLILLVAIFRRQRFAIVALWSIMFSILGLSFSGGHWIGWLWVGGIAALSVVCVSRFGLLAMAAFHTFFAASFHNAITADVSRWYFSNTVAAAVFLLGLSVFGFYTSLAGQKIFKREILAD
jgi:hypothetical protein